jgi:hypothetical protein
VQLGRGKREVIDVVALDSEANSVLAVLIQATPWEGSPKRWKKLQSRLNAAVELLLDDYAMSEHKTIELYVPVEPTWGAEVLQAARDAVAAHGVDLVVKVGLPG